MYIEIRSRHTNAPPIIMHVPKDCMVSIQQDISDSLELQFTDYSRKKTHHFDICCDSAGDPIMNGWRIIELINNAAKQFNDTKE